ncbi:MAG TPA: hypothetical protein DIS73_05900 [Planctomycetia bacterium]|nr:hypothetical protein [Planctomycetia bacterium]
MKTKSEETFERFLRENKLEFEKIEEGSSPRPDYLVKTRELNLVFEIKQLAEDENFKTESFEVSSRKVGEHIRKKIHDSRRQIQFAAKQGIPAVLLIYNNIDPMHLFGTENHDFICAMYGEYTFTYALIKDKITDRFYGQNQSLSEMKNTSFSAVGRLSPYLGKMKVTLFENVFSKVKIQYDRLPACFDVIRIQIADDNVFL